MREILFKAKRLGNGEWVEGYYIKYIKPNNGEIEHRIFESDGYGITWYTVIEETVCQFTGLKDENGNKIWENDIVCTSYIDPIFGDIVSSEIDDDFRWKVVFYKGTFCVENETKRIYLHDFTNGNNIKVMCSAIDNPELLKGGSK